jgi:hypothetical protein
MRRMYHAVTQTVPFVPDPAHAEDSAPATSPQGEPARAEPAAAVPPAPVPDVNAAASPAPEPAARESESGPESSAKKERVLHTRVPAVLERELKRFAENLRIPVSNLVRAILEDAVSMADAATESVEVRLKHAAQQLENERERLKKRVKADPLADVIAFQAVTLAQHASCAKCLRELAAGEAAHLCLVDSPVSRPRLFVCAGCLPKP